MDTRRADTLEALSVYLDRQRSLLRRTQADIDRLNQLKHDALANPAHFVKNAKQQVQALDLRNSELDDFTTGLPDTFDWSPFHASDPTPLRSFALTTRLAHTQRSIPSCKQRTPLSALQQLVKDARRTIIEPAFAIFADDPELNLNATLNANALARATNTAASNQANTNTHKSSSARTKASSGNGKNGANAQRRESTAVMRKRERERARIRELKKRKVGGPGSAATAISTAKANSAVFVRHDIGDESAEVDISIGADRHGSSAMDVDPPAAEPPPRRKLPIVRLIVRTPPPSPSGSSSEEEDASDGSSNSDVSEESTPVPPSPPIIRLNPKAMTITNVSRSRSKTAHAHAQARQSPPARKRKPSLKLQSASLNFMLDKTSSLPPTPLSLAETPTPSQEFSSPIAHSAASEYDGMAAYPAWNAYATTAANGTVDGNGNSNGNGNASAALNGKTPIQSQAQGQARHETYKVKWTDSEQHLLERLMEEIPDGEKNRWAKISQAMGGRRTARQVASRVQKYFEKLKLYGVGMGAGQEGAG
ncbi:hypothetical protein CONPUDRAFT_155170 [Coniophora puteana RWD-64-598 SS2]|uniref:Uncharacterized protein n=1 Tax=Coniophora puteana (strain RWD-64-598) TaxID=741705 RepID=A0A5M3MLX9_CONPW|nr:uncharacterized protein CONPUDRAFT_155170 [Coniophora puteana RWD-64-598 SS2]EIW79774.1 hypothetical protein CONPUDRAFT_155170 [Coniophora puteana RWD-64-598 SS2]